MLGTETAAVTCPYCGEAFDIVIDCSIDQQQYIEDCFVCCRPINFSISVDHNGNVSIDAQHEND